MAGKRGRGAILAGAMALGSAATGVSQVSAINPPQQQQVYQQNYEITTGGNREQLDTSNSLRMRMAMENDDIDVSNERATSVIKKVRDTLNNNVRIKGQFGAPDEFVKVVETSSSVNSRDHLNDLYEFTISARGKNMLIGVTRVKDNQQYSNVRYNFHTVDEKGNINNNVTLNQLRDRLNNFFKGTRYEFDNKFNLSIKTTVDQMFVERQLGYNQGMYQGMNYGYNQGMYQGMNYGYNQGMYQGAFYGYNQGMSQAYNQAAFMFGTPWMAQAMANSMTTYQMQQNMMNNNMTHNNMMYNNQNTYNQQQQQQQQITPNSVIDHDTYVDKFFNNNKFDVNRERTELRIKSAMGRSIVYRTDEDKFYKISNEDLDWRTADPDQELDKDTSENFRGLVKILQDNHRLKGGLGKITGVNTYQDADGATHTFQIFNNRLQGDKQQIFITSPKLDRAVVYDIQSDKVYLAEEGKRDLKDVNFDSARNDSSFLNQLTKSLSKLLKASGQIK